MDVNLGISIITVPLASVFGSVVPSGINTLTKQWQPKSSTETLDSKLKENGYRDNRSDVESFGVLVAAEREN